MYKAITFLILMVASSAQSQPFECPNFQIHLLIPHETDCSRFYQCDHGRKVLQSCAAGTLFDSVSRRCTWPWAARCHIASPPSTTTTTTTQAPFLPNGCPSDFNVHLLLPHGTDCSKYYQCSNGEKIARSCGPGMLFDNNLGRCNLEQYAECADGATTSTAAPTTTTASPTTPVQQFLPNGCPADHNIHLLLPHEYDCAKYYSCSNGQKTEMSCAPGTLFDFERQICNFPIFVTCHTSTTQTPSTSTPGTDFLPNGCPANVHIHYLLPHDSDCAKFYQCDHGQKVERSCAAGTWFDYNLQVCNHIHLVNCVLGSSSTTSTVSTIPPGTVTTTTKAPSTTTETSTTTPGTDFLPNGCPANVHIHYLLPHDSDCAKFYQCDHGQKVERSCAAGTWFDYNLQVCNHIHLVNCILGSSTTSTTNATTTTAESPSPTTEITESTTKVQLPTTETTVTSTEAPSPTTESIVTSTVPPSPTTETTVTSTKAPSPTTETTVTPTKAPSPTTESAPRECPTNIHHLLPHESDCAKFYQCVHGRMVERSCAPGTWFDYQLQVCNHIHLVNCELGSSTTSTTNATTTTAESPSPTTETTVTSTEPPTPTTESTVTSTDAPPTTTESTTTSTKAPSPTTESTVTTTEPPSPTTETTVTSTEAPIPTTESTITSTDAPPTTTESTTTSTKAPSPTTESTVITTEPPSPTTETTVTSTEAPIPTTESTVTSTDAPPTTTESTTTSTKAPSPTTESTVTTTEPPSPTTETTVTSTKAPIPTTESTVTSTDASPTTTESITTSTTAQSPTTETTVTSTQAPSPTTESAPRECPTNIHHLLPHDSDCAKFYQCVHGRMVERSCAPGTWFDYQLQVKIISS
ncbi:unnamed protein product [Arctia plantaginis]|uniref:Chitin-binding type-2 domain-containing protein n=1 Tax=Arctia plantaginis TaxID=874455 RepID=A0A8S0ZTH1_ARCPL|nr:unnamed protein product [Arctia plantaginis]